MSNVCKQWREENENNKLLRKIQIKTHNVRVIQYVLKRKVDDSVKLTEISHWKIFKQIDKYWLSVNVSKKLEQLEYEKNTIVNENETETKMEGKEKEQNKDNIIIAVWQDGTCECEFEWGSWSDKWF